MAELRDNALQAENFDHGIVQALGCAGLELAAVLGEHFAQRAEMGAMGGLRLVKFPVNRCHGAENRSGLGRASLGYNAHGGPTRRVVRLSVSRVKCGRVKAPSHQVGAGGSLDPMKTREETKRDSGRKKKTAKAATQTLAGPWKAPASSPGGGKSLAEWCPGEPARRGYEKAVEDWWWL